MIIRFDMGDFSLDGHEKTEPIYAECSHSSDEIAEAYHKATEETDFYLHEEVCRNYGEHWITKGALNTLLKLGWTLPANFDDQLLYIEDIFNMFIFMVRLGNSEISIQVVIPEQDTFFRCGLEGRNFGLGYGLF